MITRVNDLVECKLGTADKILLLQVLLILFVVHVVSLEDELLIFLEEVVNFELLDKVWVRVVPDGLRSTQDLLHSLSASLVESINYDETV